jgi:hypothetical protein
MTAFWDNVSGGLVKVDRRFRGTHWIYHQDLLNIWDRTAHYPIRPPSYLLWQPEVSPIIHLTNNTFASGETSCRWIEIQSIRQHVILILRLFQNPTQLLTHKPLPNHKWERWRRHSAAWRGDQNAHRFTSNCSRHTHTVCQLASATLHCFVLLYQQAGAGLAQAV